MTIEVAWDDGRTDLVEVANDSYLVVRKGCHRYSKIQALNADGKGVYTHEQPEPAPGDVPGTGVRRRRR